VTATKTLIVADHLYHAHNYAQKHNIPIMEAVYVTPERSERIHGLMPKTIVDIRRGRSRPNANRRMDDLLRILRHRMPKPKRARNTGSIQDRFERFHGENPHIYKRLEEMTQAWLKHGHTKCSIHMLWETLRWQAGTGFFSREEEYKLNDHYPARYARMLVENHPAWEGVFNLRALRAA
jgi:hypothetical protein